MPENLDRFNRKLDEWKARVSGVAATKEIPLPELFPSEFMTAYTTFPTFQAMADTACPGPQTPEEFWAMVGSDAFRDLIVSRTKFSSWEEMKIAAAEAWGKRKLEGR